MWRWRQCWAVLLSGVLCACGGGIETRRAALTPDPERLWVAHSRAVAAFDHWQLTGRIGVSATGRSYHAALFWQQWDRRYTLRLVGPLGQGALLLDGDAQRVVLRTGRGERVVAEDAGALLARYVGVAVPVTSLRYWVRGLPAPDVPHRRVLDAQGRLHRLVQNGWTMDYLVYHAPGRERPAMPARIHLTQGAWQVRVFAADWQPIRAEQPAVAAVQ